MWVLKLEKTSENTFIGHQAMKNNVSLSGYPINHQVQDDRVIVNVAGFIEGAPKDIDRFVKNVRKEREMLRIQCNDNFLLATLDLDASVAVLYDPRIIFVQPAKYGKDGTEILELASWEKEPLMHLVELFKRLFNCKVLGFSQKRIRSIGLISIHPDLTEKQRRALQLAVQHGYYAFPRRITLAKLAEIMGVSFSTYQAHLAKAEAHFVPEMVGKFL